MTNHIGVWAEERTPKGSLKEEASAVIEDWRDRLSRVNAQIFATPELAFNEYQAAALLAQNLTTAGFETQVGAYGLETAVEAVYGSGDLVVVVCAEYDALPDIGHACGHNLIATAALGAAIGLRAVADQLGIQVRLLGTPAEEHGGGKAILLENGAWDDASFSLMVHGTTGTDLRVEDVKAHAVDRFTVTYQGRSSHAASAPDRGINASDAAIVALGAIGLLRQQLGGDVRANAFIQHGGEVTNVIPARTVIQAEVRALELSEWKDAKERILRCFEAGAIATGCSWTHDAMEPDYLPLLQDPLLSEAWNRNLRATGRRPQTRTNFSIGSTDMGNVSQALPAIHPVIAILGSIASPHTVDFKTAAGSPAAQDAALDAAHALAWTVIDIAVNPQARSTFANQQRLRNRDRDERIDS